NRAGAAVPFLGAVKSHDLGKHRQPARQIALQQRLPILVAASLAMADQGRSHIVADAVADELKNFVARLLDRQAMQVQHGLDLVASLAKPAKNAILNAVAL